MAVQITIADLRAFAPSLEISDASLEVYLCLVNKLDDCLDANYPDDCTQKAIKLNALAHFAQVSEGRFIKSQRAPSGASRSFDYIQGKEGIKLTNYGRMLEMLDTAKCFEGLFPQGDTVGCISLGRKCRE